jgi:hypothetical protein
MNVFERQPAELGKLLGLVELLPAQEPRQAGLGAALADAADAEAADEAALQRRGALQDHRVLLVDADVQQSAKWRHLGPMLLIFKIFPPKKFAKNVGVFFAQTTAMYFFQKIIITLVLEKNDHFFAKN